MRRLAIIQGVFVSFAQSIPFLDKPCKAWDMDLPGHDIDSVLDVQTWDDCSDLCTQNSACSFWTWVDNKYTLNPAIINKCHLKNGKSSMAPVAGLVSGVSGCTHGKKSNQPTKSPQNKDNSLYSTLITNTHKFDNIYSEFILLRLSKYYS